MVRVELSWGTLVVNVVGCFLLGALMTLAEIRLAITPEERLFLAIGVLGSMTTFSTFSYETLELLRRAEALAALANAAVSLFLGLAAVLAGRLVVRWVTM